jgi:transcriptional regulator with XRE-family HTH domain
MLVQLTPRLVRCAPRFPNRIRSYRLQAELTQRALAERIGQRRATISAWERGRHLPTVPNLFRLARALDTLGESLYWSLYIAARQEPGDHHTPQP